MRESLYEVIYIDKFFDIAEAEIVRQGLQKHFHLDEKTIEYMSTGKPVVIKKNVDRNAAERLKSVVDTIGGTCWVQEVSLSRHVRERRLRQRRQLISRRKNIRASSILPDRRIKGRRSDDVTRRP